MHGVVTVYSSQNRSLDLVLNSITYTESESVVYRASVDGAEIEFRAAVSDIAGIRSVVMSDDFESFLRPFCRADPAIVKRLIKLTWAVIEGDSPVYPVHV